MERKAHNSSFYKLPTELILLIIQAISSPRDLHALIRVSPFIHDIFLERKTAILTNVIRQAIHPDVLPLAVLLCHIVNDLDARKICSEDMKRRAHVRYGNCATTLVRALSRHPLLDSYRKFREELIALKDEGGDVLSGRRLKPDGNEAVMIQDNPLMLSTLCRICDATDAFVCLYSTDMLNSFYWRGKKKIQGLSKTEHGRFQRATLNYMNFRCLSEDGKYSRKLWETNSCRQLNSSECRELNSLYDYITDWTHSCFNDIRYYATSRIELEEKGKEEEEKASRICGMRRYSSQQDVNLRKLRLFLEKEGLGRFKTVPRIIDRGIPFCTRFFGMTMEEQVDVALPLFEAPSEQFYSGQRSSLFPQHDGEGTEEDKLTVLRYRKSAGIDDNAGKRSAGYFFWDEDRLRMLEGDEPPAPGV